MIALSTSVLFCFRKYLVFFAYQIMKHFFLTLTLFSHLLVNAQIDERYYGSRFNVSLMHTRINATNANNSGKNVFTSINMFDFNFGDPDKYKSYFEGNMRVISDLWWMIGKELGEKTNYLKDGYTASVFEFKWGINVVSGNKLLITPGLGSNSYWTVFNGHRSWVWCIGPMFKIDYLLLNKLLIRNITDFDIPFTRSTGSLFDRSNYLTNRTEFISPKGFFLGIDFLKSVFVSNNPSIPKSRINRWDFRLGYKINM
jgi:hypothetical protein